MATEPSAKAIKSCRSKNNYQMAWKNLEDFTEGEGVFNGDVGFIRKVDREFNELTVVYDEVRYVTYHFNQLEELELAYASDGPQESG